MPIDEFRAKARAWLEANAKPYDEADEYHFSLEESKRFQKALWDAGLAGITWPKEYGGQGLGAAEQVAFNQEAADFALPTGPFVIGLGMPAPTIMELGTEEMKKRHLPKMVSGEEIWCQLFSEPSGGSDVASLRTTAKRTENGWVINGQKVWTTGAQFSDFGAIIARTDPEAPKHQGITMFVVDMHHPGVTVRPLKVATGDSPFNEVFFDDVEVPADAVIGEVNRGWQASVIMLRNERVTIGASGRSRASVLSFETLADLAGERGLTEDPSVRRTLAELYAKENSTRAFGRLLHERATSGIPIGAAGSAAKLAGAELHLWTAEAVQEVFGPLYASGDPELVGVVKGALGAPGNATAGGTNEIQRNIIAERVLGLPKDPGVDRNLPFNQIRFGN
ncbi:acyl-CoA dehydrogenase family protein [Nocardioides insulae]|uniref:acyl-CoA dehydrogenase family protein n=1 Tax=Nocardioides insulae TaxID=394734 RepID=UPI0003F83A3F|nr:acyl-CoA dehydrogenase family protein [Nocardioides insulae]